MKELTFKEVITNIKEGETWTSKDYIIKYSHGTISIKTKNGEVFNGIAFCDDMFFKLQRRQYNFDEAFKFLKEGREIENMEGEKYHFNSEGTLVYENKVIYNHLDGSDKIFTLDEIKGKWYIND